MFASAVAAGARRRSRSTIPLGKAPRQIERPRRRSRNRGPQWAAACDDFDDWDKPAPPVRIHGNTYLVGTCGISAILVTGDEGHVLIDAGTEKGAELIADNIRALGFQLDGHQISAPQPRASRPCRRHRAAAAIDRRDAGRLRAGGEGAQHRRCPSTDDPQAGMHKPFPAANVGRVVMRWRRGALGNLMLTAMATPGHTPGALSWRWESCDGGVCRTMVYADSLSPVSRDDYRFSDHPDYLAAYRASIAKIAASRCEILLTPHPSASAMKERMTGKQPLFDPDGCRRLCRRA